MLLHTRGIVLRMVKYAESSIISDLFTDELGRASFITSGVRTKKPRFAAGLFQPLSLVELIAYQKPQLNLHRVKELRPAHVHSLLFSDVRRSAVGLFSLEVVQKTVKLESPEPALFQFLWDYFIFLDTTTQPVSNTYLCFMMALSGYLGFQPLGTFDEAHPYFDLQSGRYTDAPTNGEYLEPEWALAWSALYRVDYTQAHELPFDHEQRSILLDHLLFYYRQHLPQLSPFTAHIVLHDVFR